MTGQPSEPLSREELERWEKDNTCGICPYRRALQARVEELERHRDIAGAVACEWIVRASEAEAREMNLREALKIARPFVASFGSRLHGPTRAQDIVDEALAASPAEGTEE